MARRIDFNFSHVFEGNVWNTLVSAQNNLLILEVRSSEQKLVTFSALAYDTGEFLWRNVTFDEPWWITLGATEEAIVLFTVYMETHNPDSKGVFAYHIFDKKIVWWNNDFSLISVSNGQVHGVTAKYGMRSTCLDLHSGKGVEPVAAGNKRHEEVVRPHQYLDDNAYFATVKTFLNRKFNLLPVIALEYLEYDSNIFISFYIQEENLANYLLIISADGEVLMNVRLDDHLKGIGLDTFFVISDRVFFVKNKVELFSYKLV